MTPRRDLAVPAHDDRDGSLRKRFDFDQVVVGDDGQARRLGPVSPADTKRRRKALRLVARQPGGVDGLQ